MKFIFLLLIFLETIFCSPILTDLTSPLATRACTINSYPVEVEDYEDYEFVEFLTPASAQWSCANVEKKSGIFGRVSKFFQGRRWRKEVIVNPSHILFVSEEIEECPVLNEKEHDIDIEHTSASIPSSSGNETSFISQLSRRIGAAIATTLMTRTINISVRMLTAASIASLSTYLTGNPAALPLAISAFLIEFAIDESSARYIANTIVLDTTYDWNVMVERLSRDVLYKLMLAIRNAVLGLVCLVQHGVQWSIDLID